MGEPILVHVAQALEELLEVVASHGFSQLATKGDEVKKLSASDQLQHKVLHEFPAFLRMSLVAFSYLNEADDVAVSEVGQDVELGLYAFFDLFYSLFHDFDGVSCPLVVPCKLDLAGDAASERASEFVLVVENNRHKDFSFF